MTNLIGIVQGRLLKSPKNRLQFFPKKKWREEFIIAKETGYDFIEFFSERILNKNNPIWNKENIKEYKKLSKINKLKILNFCDDYIISNDLTLKYYNNYFIELISKCNLLGIKNLILPLYGKSNLDNKNIDKFIPILKKLSTYSKNFKIKLLIETNLEEQYLKYLFYKVGNNYLKLLYDTGNRITNPNNSYEDIIKLSKYIEHVHIKDKTYKNKNVIIGRGDVDFDIIFEKLKDIKYKKNFTFETNKGVNPIKTSLNNIKFIEKMIRKHRLI